MKIGDKAEQADQPEVRLARDSVGVYRLESDEVVPADEIGSDEFPQFGDFIRCQTSHGGANPSWDEEVFVELPAALAEIIVELEIETGECFRIQSARKNPAGEWVYAAEDADDPTA